jgi:hypothetical protein
MWYYFKEKFEDIKVVIQRRTCITMAKRKKVQKDKQWSAKHYAEN